MVGDRFHPYHYLDEYVHVAWDAGFEADPTKGALPLEVTFNPSVSGYAYDQWDLGDATVLRPPAGVFTHTYTDNGIFSVKRTVGDGAGNRTSTTKQHYIRVEPYAEFAQDRHKCVIMCDVQFTDKSGGDDLTYAWDFGDGQTSTDRNPRHTYNLWAVGDSSSDTNYRIKLTVTDALGLSHTASDYITLTAIPDPPPDPWGVADNTAFVPQVNRGYAVHKP